MHILTLEPNKAYNLDTIPDEIDEIRYAILDNSVPSQIDYYFSQLLFLETFTSPAAVLQIGNRRIKMPLDWQILMGDTDIGSLEAVPLSSVANRGFKCFEYNPRSAFRPTFLDVDVIDIYHSVTWQSPILRAGHYLCVPIDDGLKPRCVYFIRDTTKATEVVDFNKCF